MGRREQKVALLTTTFIKNKKSSITTPALGKKGQPFSRDLALPLGLHNSNSVNLFGQTVPMSGASHLFLVLLTAGASYLYSSVSWLRLETS